MQPPPQRTPSPGRIVPAPANPPTAAPRPRAARLLTPDELRLVEAVLVDQAEDLHTAAARIAAETGLELARVQRTLRVPLDRTSDHACHLGGGAIQTVDELQDADLLERGPARR